MATRAGVRLRTTHTYNRSDVALAVQQEAARRGCTPQDVVNDILARVLIDGALQRLEREIDLLSLALGRGAGRASTPAAIVAPAPPMLCVTDDAPALPPRRGGGNLWD